MKDFFKYIFTALAAIIMFLVFIVGLTVIVPYAILIESRRQRDKRFFASSDFDEARMESVAGIAALNIMLADDPEELERNTQDAFILSQAPAEVFDQAMQRFAKADNVIPLRNIAARYNKRKKEFNEGGRYSLAY
jgi:hypothetical protein